MAKDPAERQQDTRDRKAKLYPEHKWVRIFANKKHEKSIKRYAKGLEMGITYKGWTIAEADPEAKGGYVFYEVDGDTSQFAYTVQDAKNQIDKLTEVEL